MTWTLAKPKLETNFKAANWSVIHNQTMDVLVVTTLQRDIYFFGEDKNPDNLSGFTFNSLLDSTPRYTLDSVEEFIACFIKNN
jgi:hypothetical protein